jgi:spore maturation protein CgeB
MDTRLLIIGDTTERLTLGTMLVEAGQEIDNLSISSCSNSWNIYAPSMNNIGGKLFYRLSGNRPIEWWKFNKLLVEQIDRDQPTLILVTGLFPLDNKVFDYCEKHSIKIVNYLTDSPFRSMSCPKFLENIKRYTLIYSTKKAIVARLADYGARDVRFLLFGFHPNQHHLPKSDTSSNDISATYPDVCIVGGADIERATFVIDFLKTFNGSLGLYGADWNRYKKLSNFCKGYVKDESYCRVLNKSKLNIGLVRRSNQDEHSMRSFEIAACGGVGIYEDTSVHRDLLPGYPEYGFFSSSEDLAEKCNWLLANLTELEKMKAIGINIIMDKDNTYTARLRTILDWRKS